MNPGDILAVRGKGLFSRMILRATSGEISHVGLVISADPALILEALIRVQTRPLKDAMRDAKDVYLLQPINFSAIECREIVKEACRWSARSYGYGKILLHALDALFGTEWFSRHLAISNHPICSWLIAEAYRHEGYDFGEPSGSVTPGDIFAFAQAHPDKYRIIRLSTILSTHSQGLP